MAEVGPEITDVAGEPATPEQLERLVARYHWTASYCGGRDVLEVACGTGQGLGLLKARARKLFGCDLSPENLKLAARSAGGSVPLVRADAELLPFADHSLDVVIILEAIYFLPSSDAFLTEARRVLRPNGRCVISAINKGAPDFNPNHSLYRRLYGAPELSQQLREHGFLPECFGIIPKNQPSRRDKMFQPVKKLAVGLDVIPESKRARLFLKRIVFGELQTIPHDISSLPAPAAAPQPISSDTPDTVHQVILCAGTLT